MSTDLKASYQGVYENRIGFGKRPALLLVDFVQAYFDPNCDLYAGVESALASAFGCARQRARAGIPVVYTNVVYQKQALNGGRFYQKAKPLRHFLEGSPMGAWPAGLDVGEDELVVSKQYPSAFFGTSLASTLTTWGIDTLIITGLTTSGCVRASCVDACCHGFIPIVVREALRRPPRRAARGQSFRHGCEIRRRGRRERGSRLSGDANRRGLVGRSRREPACRNTRRVSDSNLRRPGRHWSVEP